MSELNTLFRFLFFIFDVPNLWRSGACLIPSSIIIYQFKSLLPSNQYQDLFFNRPVEVNAFFPKFTMFPKSLPLCMFWVFFVISVQFVMLFLLLHLLVGFFYLTLSYLDTKDCLFGNVTRCAVTGCLNNIWSPSSPFTTKYFF